MNNRMLGLIKEAGFHIQQDGSIVAPRKDDDITEEITSLIKLLDQEPKISRWEGYVDRQSGSFTSEEILSSTIWR